MKAAKPYGKKLFAEEQLFRHTWVWTVVIIGLLASLAGIVVGILADKSTKPVNAVIGVSVVLIVEMINVTLFYLARLDTVVTDEAIFYRWWPFFKKYHVVSWPDLKDAYAKKYPFFKYGYHRRRGFGKVHVVKGKQGIQLILQNGQQIYLGTQRLPAFEQALHSVKIQS